MPRSPLPDLPVAQDMIGTWLGYDHQIRIDNAAFFDMQNMSSDLFPVASQRPRRAKVMEFAAPQGLYAKEQLAWVDSNRFYYAGAYVADVTPGEKQLVGMGAHIIIWPDATMYNIDKAEYTQLGAQWAQMEGGIATYSLATIDGDDYGDYIISPTAPADPTDATVWLDTSSTPHVLKRFSVSSGMWIGIPTTYVKIACTGIGAAFKKQDGLTIKNSAIDTLNADTIAWSVSDNAIVVVGLIDQVTTQDYDADAPLTVERRIPPMDFICESGNRIWGCSSANHEVYCCKLGDPTNWFSYIGIASDSYAATVGSDGPFTGVAAFESSIYFFKDDRYHRLWGSVPSNFQLTEIQAAGVAQGSHKSLAVVNSVLYYLSIYGVMAYSGGRPSPVSQAFGERRYKRGVGGIRGSKYYLSVEDEQGRASLFVLDTEKGMWHREDDARARWFAPLDNETYFVAEPKTDGGPYALMSIGGHGSADLEGPLPWFVESGNIGLESPDRKYITRLQIRAEMSAGATLRVGIAHDSSSYWEWTDFVVAKTMRSFYMPVRVRHCDHFRVRLEGVGECRIISMSKHVEQGSDWA
jgi:hypothetical protein